MLTRLHVRGFKSLRDVEVEFARLVVLFGPNAAGKSNLLESVVLLSRLVGERTLAEAFDSGIRGYPVEAFSFAGAHRSMARSEATLDLAATVTTSDEDSLDYFVKVGIRPETGELWLADERLARMSSAGKPVGKPVIEAVTTAYGTELRIRRKDRQGHPVVEQPGGNHTLVSNGQYENAERFPDVLGLRREVATWRMLYLDPRESMRRSQPPREVDHIGERGEWLVPFLHRLSANPAHQAAFDGIRRAVRSVVPSIEDVRTELVAARGEVDLEVRQDGEWMSARVLSEGTLRVLALCAMAANPFHNGLVAFEEPENGVQPRRIEVITRILASAARRRQVLLTTHSPLVIAQVMRLVKAGELQSSDVALVACSGGPDGTRVSRLPSTPDLFADNAVAESLASSEDVAVLQAMQERGWLDG